MFKIKILSIFLTISVYTFSQTPAEADSLFANGNYEQSFTAYQALSKRFPKENLYTFRFAQSAYELKLYDTAIELFNKSAAKEPKSYSYLGEYYFTNYLFDNAIEAYSKLLSKLEESSPEFTLTETALKRAELGKRLLNRVEDIEFVDSTVVDKSNFLSKIPLLPDLGKISQTRLNLGENGFVDNIQYTNQRDVQMYSSEYVSGSSDLFSATKLLDSWSEKQPISDLNTTYNENYPFLLLDGVTLYFASDGEDSMGGYDIFITRQNTSDNSYLKPENIGMPFNSPFNDYMLVLDELRNVGWFASDRFQPEGKVAIYRFIPNREKKIVRAEDTDSLINRAKITEFSLAKIDFNSKTELTKPTAPTVKQIFINDNISYSSANEFKSNIARNTYFQLQKLTEEKESIETELTNQRKKYYESTASEKQNLSREIRLLESRLRVLPLQIKNLTKQMRNEEIKVNP